MDNRYDLVLAGGRVIDPRNDIDGRIAAVGPGLSAAAAKVVDVSGLCVTPGMSLPDVVYRSTWRPAQVIGRRDLGHLSPGAEADVAVLEVQEGESRFVDSTRSTMPGAQKLCCHLTLRRGEIVWDLHGRSFPDWRDALPPAWLRD